MNHPIIARLHSDEPAERRHACEAAAADPSAVLLADELVRALGDPDPGVVRAAAQALQRIGDADAVLAALQDALHADDPRQRLEAAWTWARLEAPPLKLLPVVASALAFVSGDARWRAVRLLVELGRLHGEVLPLVRGLAREEASPRVRRLALAALRELAPHDPPTVQAHLDASRAPDLGLARLALAGLAGLPDPLPEVWERLAEVLEESADPVCRRAAAAAAAALPGEPPERLRRALERAASPESEAALRAAAARALARTS